MTENDAASGYFDIDEGIPQNISWDYAPPKDLQRGDASSPQPWWSALQALAWIASGSVDFAQHIGVIEQARYGPVHPKAALGQLHEIVMEQFCQCGGVPEPEQAWWEHCSCVQTASKSLFAAIKEGRITAYSDSGNELSLGAFTSLDCRSSGADWVGLGQSTKFASDDLIRQFPPIPTTNAFAASREVASVGDARELSLRPQLSADNLQKWWNGLAAGERAKPHEVLWELCRAKFPDKFISRERVRELDPGRKRGPKPLSGKMTAK